MASETMTVAERITEYLSFVGLFNPELMDREMVRDLLIDCRAECARKDAEIAAFRAFLEGAEYPKIDEMAKMNPHDARNLGIVVAALTRNLSNPGAPRDGE